MGAAARVRPAAAGLHRAPARAIAPPSLPAEGARDARRRAGGHAREAAARLRPMIHHVAFEVPRERWVQCAAFYALLGFERFQSPPSLADRAAWLHAGPTPAHFLHV